MFEAEQKSNCTTVNWKQYQV